MEWGRVNNLKCFRTITNFDGLDDMTSMKKAIKNEQKEEFFDAWDTAPPRSVERLSKIMRKNNSS